MAARRIELFALLVLGCENPIPTTTAPIDLDGKLREPDWNGRALSRKLVDDERHTARPYSEVRLLRDQAHLYLGLYAADEDIRKSDFFAVTIGSDALRFHPDGTVEPPRADVHAAVDTDGTLDNAADDDEEWVVEASLPLGRGRIAVQRCDMVKSGERRCGKVELHR